ncbi:MAG: hypothetical protein KAW66_06400, partial [Candidatus Lokiarchaeota archaeon]|nr:hypothetical protein [Candidatus Lokiarchaeota archaeon]
MLKKDSKEKNKHLAFETPSPIFIIGLISFFTVFSTEMILNILPLFTISIGGTPLILGLIAGVSSLSLYILYSIWSRLRDQFKTQKQIIICGCIISNISKPFIGLSPSWGYVLGLKAAECAGNQIRSYSCDDFCSCLSNERGKASRLNKSLESLGLIFGSFFAFFLILMNWSYTQIILFSIIPGIITVILMLLLKSNKRVDFISNSKSHNSPPIEDFKNPSSTKLYVIIGILELASLDALFLVIRAIDFISMNVIFLIPLFFSGSNIIYLLVSDRLFALAHKRGKKPVMVLGLILLLFSSILLIIPYEVSGISLFLIIISFLLYGFSKASLTPLSRSFVNNLIGENGGKKSKIKWFVLIGGFALVKSVLLGFIYYLFTFSGAFMFMVALLLISLIFVTF